MTIVESDKVAFFDVDDSLIEWVPTTEPYLLEHFKKDLVKIGQNYHRVHRKHLANLKGHHLRGHKVVVWSAGGYAWAAKAVRLLKIEKYVDIVMSKPAWWIDDQKADEVLTLSNHRYYGGW